jgi:hypothetical protein
VRITSAEWKGGRWTNGVLLASLALFAHGIAFVALTIAVGRPGRPLQLPPRVASRAQPEHLRFVAPASPAPTLRNGSIGGDRPQRRVTADIPRGTRMQSPPTDTGASVTAALSASSPTVRPTVGSLAIPLPVDPRLLVLPGSANNGPEARLHDINVSIASGVRGVNDSIARYRRGWTVGDSTHRLGIAPCGVEVWVVCIPFGVGDMPNPARTGTGIDLKRAADDAEVRAAIARIRAKDSKSTDGAPEPAGP